MKIKKGKQGKCHINAFNIYKKHGLKIAVGFYVERRNNEIYSIPHIWNIDDDGYVVEPTEGDWDGEYYGKIVTKKYTSGGKLFDGELWPIYTYRIGIEEDLRNVVKELCLTNFKTYKNGSI